MTARSFRLVLVLVLKCFAWRQTAEVVSLSVRAQQPLSCARVWMKKKTECCALCFSHGSGALGESPGAVKRMASPEQGESAAGSPHSTSVPEEMDFDLFGPSSRSPSAQPPTTAAQVPGSGSAPTGVPVQLPVPPTSTLGANQLQQLMLQMLNNQNT